MSTPVIATKLYIPPPRPRLVHRPRLLERLAEGLHRKLTLISAPAGFGKTTLLSEWVAGCQRPAAWLSLEEGDKEPARFLRYLVVALQTVVPGMGEGVLGALESTQPPPIDSLLAALLNELSAAPDEFLLVLDDYHLVSTPPLDEALTFVLKHQPPQLHLLMATREDPPLSLARLRARGQLTELRAADLRFTPAEAADFLKQVMGLDLAPDDILALEKRTEGWIAGLQLAALSLQRHPDNRRFIDSFSGSHHFVLDYLLEEVLHQQPAAVQEFLLQTSILARLCGPLCDAVTDDAAALGQARLEYLERANLFLVPLDDERRWYRYHHLFADLLRGRLASEGRDVAELHIRASAWFEANDLALEAFQHAAAANDLDRAARLVEGGGMPLYYRGAAGPVLAWLASLPPSALAERPALWVMLGTVQSVLGQNTRVEETLHGAEHALAGHAMDEQTRDLLGRIAAVRAILAGPTYQVETIIRQARRALDYLHPDNLAVRTAVTRTLGLAYHFQGERAAAGQAYRESIEMSQQTGNVFIDILASTGLGIIQESDTQLHAAADTYRHVLALAGDPPSPTACEAYLGLGRIHYQWNELEAAQSHVEAGIRLARQIESIDSAVSGEVMRARLKLAQGDLAGARATLAQADEVARREGYLAQVPQIAAAQTRRLLLEGDLAGAAQVAGDQVLPRSQARVHLAAGEPGAARALLRPVIEQAEAKGWPDEKLKALVVLALAHQALGERDKAVEAVSEALAMADGGGYVRLFLDEGRAMAPLLAEVAGRGLMANYAGRLLAAFKAERERRGSGPGASIPPEEQPLLEPLSERELEVLRLVAAGLSNKEIGQRLFLALDTVKGTTGAFLPS